MDTHFYNVHYCVLQVGPAGSIMGIMTGLLVYVILELKRKKFHNPCLQLSKVLVIIGFFLILGLLLPYVDNFAHFGGLFAGLFLGAIFSPYYVLIDDNDTLEKIDKRKWILILILSVLFIILYGALFTIFYEVQPNCYGCQFFTCMPYTDTICQDQRPTPDHRDVDILV